MALTAGELEAVLKLREDVTAKVDTILKKVDEFASKTPAATAKAGSGFSAMGNILSGIAMGAGMKIWDAMVSGIGRVIGVIPQAIAAYAGKEAAVNRLNSVLRGQGQATAEASAAYLSESDALSRATGFTSDAIGEVQMQLIALGKSRGEVSSTTQAVMDLAAATGQDMATASGSLMGAVSGSARALKAWGVVVDEGLPKSQRFADAVRQVNDRFGGAAAAQLGTYAGFMKNMGNASSSAFEAIGEGVLSSGKLRAAFEQLRVIAWKIVEVIDRNKDSIRAFVNGAVVLAAGAIPLLAYAILGGYLAFVKLKLSVLENLGVFDAIKTRAENLWSVFRLGVSVIGVLGAKLALYSEAMNAIAMRPWDAKNILAGVNAVAGAMDSAIQVQAQNVNALVGERDAAHGRYMEQLNAEAGETIATSASTTASLMEMAAKAEAMRAKIANAPDVVGLAPTGGPGTKPRKVADVDEKAIDALRQKVAEFSASLTSAAATARSALAGGIGGGLMQIDAQMDASIAKIAELSAEAVKAGDTAFNPDKLVEQADAVRALSIEQLELSERQRLLGEGFADVDKTLDETIDAFDRFDGTQTMTNAALEGQIETWTGYREQLDQAGQDTAKVDLLLRQLQDALKARPGQNVFGALGDSAKAALKSMPGAILGALQGGGDVGKSAGAAAGNAFGAGMEKTATKALTGVLGSTLGSALGSAVPVLGTMLGGVLGGAIGGMLSGGGAKNAVKDAKKMFGVELSKDEGKAIDDQSKKLGIGRTETLLLNIEAMAQKAGKPVGDFAGKLGDLFNAIGTRAVPAKEGVAALAGAFDAMASEGTLLEHPELVDRLFQAIADGSIPATDGLDMLATAFDATAAAIEDGADGAQAAMRDLIRSAKEAGLEVAGMSEFIAAQFEGAGEDLTSIFENLSMGSEDQAALFAANWAAAVDSMGLAGALDELGPAYEAMVASMGGAVGEAAKGILGNIPELMKLNTEENRPTFDAVGALQRNVAALGTTDYLSAGSFTAAEHGTSAAYEELQAAGATSATALEAIAPMLADLQQQAQTYGFSLDAATQKLIDDAEAAGIEFKQEPTEALTSALTEETVPAILGLTEAILGSSLYGGVESFADGSGGFRDFGSGTPAMLHGREWVVTEGQGMQMFAADAGVADELRSMRYEMAQGEFQGKEMIVEELRTLRADMADQPQMMARAIRDALQLAGVA